MTDKPVRDQKRVSRKSSKKSNLRQGILAHQPVENYLLGCTRHFRASSSFTMLYASMYTHTHYILCISELSLFKNDNWILFNRVIAHKVGLQLLNICLCFLKWFPSYVKLIWPLISRGTTSRGNLLRGKYGRI